MKNKLLLIIVTTAIIFQGCKNTENNQPPETNSATTPVQKVDSLATYAEIRNLVWNKNPDSLNIKMGSDSVYCIILDMGLGDDLVASLIVIADGTTSVYLNTGEGIIGAGQYEQVRSASDSLLKMMSHPSQHFMKIENYLSLPSDSLARFYLFTRNGKYASKEFSADDAVEGKGYYSKYFIQANHVITAARTSSK